MNIKRKSILLVVISIFLLVNVSLINAEFGFDNPNLPKVTREPPAVITFNNVTGSVNSSSFWDGLDTFNTTQMENSGQVLNILVSWLTSFLLENTGDTATGNYTFDSGTFFIDSTNNRLGIGTTTPQNTLNVIGDVNVSGDLYVNQSSLYIGDAKISYAVADDDGIMLSGSIHLEPIGGVSGNLALHEGTEPVACVSNDGGRLWYNLSNDLMWQDKNSVSKKVLLEGNDGIWNFNGNKIYYNSGNVGIGTDSPNNKLNVYETAWDTANTPLVNITNLDPNANDGDVL